MAKETFSGPFDFALKINAQGEFLRRFAQGDRWENEREKNDMFPQDAFVKMYYFAIEIQVEMPYPLAPA